MTTQTQVNVGALLTLPSEVWNSVLAQFRDWTLVDVVLNSEYEEPEP